MGKVVCANHSVCSDLQNSYGVPHLPKTMSNAQEIASLIPLLPIFKMYLRTKYEFQFSWGFCRNLSLLTKKNLATEYVGEVQVQVIKKTNKTNQPNTTSNKQIQCCSWSQKVEASSAVFLKCILFVTSAIHRTWQSKLSFLLCLLSEGELAFLC